MAVCSRALSRTRRNRGPRVNIDFTLSPAGDDHYDAVFRLHETLFRTLIEPIWGWHESWQQQNFRSNWAACDTRVIMVGAEVIGYLQTLQTPEHLQLKNVGLLPAYRGRGIGRKLVGDVQTKAGTLGLPVVLSVFVTNPDAVRFYERMGFVKETGTKEFQHMRWNGGAISSIPRTDGSASQPSSHA